MLTMVSLAKGIHTSNPMYKGDLPKDSECSGGWGGSKGLLPPFLQSTMLPDRQTLNGMNVLVW